MFFICFLCFFRWAGDRMSWAHNMFRRAGVTQTYRKKIGMVLLVPKADNTCAIFLWQKNAPGRWHENSDFQTSFHYTHVMWAYIVSRIHGLFFWESPQARWILVARSRLPILHEQKTKGLPSGKLSHNYGKIHLIFHGNIHYFYGHV